VCRQFSAQFFGVVAALLVTSGAANAATAYWIRPTNNYVVDRQIAALVAAHSRLVVLRASAGSPNGPSYANIVSLFHHSGPGLQVLMYSLATQMPISGSIDGIVASNLDANPNMLVRSPGGAPVAGLPDPNNPNYQDAYIKRLVTVMREMGADGVALDESFRTPKVYPKRLAPQCAQDAEFCAGYAQGVDQLYARVKQAVEPRVFLFNGIWNEYAGMAEDQAMLLRSADAAAIEMFGGDPTKPQRSFSTDILPYLKLVSAYPDKKFLFFGRTTSMGYQSYEDDYLRQRYLYCAYLLGERAGTYFKYHATFEAPPTPGLRSGGTDMYSDWLLDVGGPIGPYSQQDGIYSREFQNAMIYVAPDDTFGGTVSLPETLYTPEGEAVSGSRVLAPGEGLLLLKSQPPPPQQESVWNVANVPGIGQMGDIESESTRYVRVGQPVMPPADILLDAVRVLRPRSHLDVSFRLDDPRARILAVAEVDDAAGQGHSPYAIVEIAHGDPRRGQIYAPSAQYRIPQGDAPGSWRLIPVEAGDAGQWQDVRLGPETFAEPGGGRIHFRRWAYLRLDGPLSFALARLTP
jgi:hypothetical protein